MPQIDECPESTSSVKDEVWDRCVKRSSLSVGISSVLGSISSIFMGPSGAVISLGFGVAWAVKHCRTLFREQKEGKNEDAVAAKEFALPKPLMDNQQDSIESQVNNKKGKRCKVKKTIAQSDDIDKKTTNVHFSFPSVFPIPDRPFGRGDLKQLKPAKNTVIGKLSKNLLMEASLLPVTVQQKCPPTTPPTEKVEKEEQICHPTPPECQEQSPTVSEQEELVRIKIDDNECECTVDQFDDCIHIECICPLPKLPEDKCTCDNNVIPNFSIKCEPPKDEQCKCTCDDDTKPQPDIQIEATDGDAQTETPICTCPRNTM